MKKTLLILFTISIMFNLFYLAKSFLANKHENEIRSLYIVKPISKSDGLNNLKQQLSNLNPNLLHKNYFIQIWDTIRCSENSINYMLQLDSIALNISNNNLCFLFISEMENNHINNYINNHNIKFKKFILLNNVGDFISSIYFQKNQKFKKSSSQFIINKDGDITYYKTSLFIDPLNDKLLIRNINKYK